MRIAPVAWETTPLEILDRCSRGSRHTDTLPATQWHAMQETSALDCRVPRHPPPSLYLRIAGSTGPTPARPDRNGNVAPASPQNIAIATNAIRAQYEATDETAKPKPHSTAVAARDCRKNIAAP